MDRKQLVQDLRSRLNICRKVRIPNCDDNKAIVDGLSDDAVLWVYTTDTIRCIEMSSVSIDVLVARCNNMIEFLNVAEEFLRPVRV